MLARLMNYRAFSGKDDKSSRIKKRISHSLKALRKKPSVLGLDGIEYIRDDFPSSVPVKEPSSSETSYFKETNTLNENTSGFDPDATLEYIPLSNSHSTLVSRDVMSHTEFVSSIDNIAKSSVECVKHAKKKLVGVYCNSDEYYHLLIEQLEIDNPHLAFKRYTAMELNKPVTDKVDAWIVNLSHEGDHIFLNDLIDIHSEALTLFLFDAVPSGQCIAKVHDFIRESGLGELVL